MHEGGIHVRTKDRVRRKSHLRWFGLGVGYTRAVFRGSKTTRAERGDCDAQGACFELAPPPLGAPGV